TPVLRQFPLEILQHYAVHAIPPLSRYYTQSRTKWQTVSKKEKQSNRKACLATGQSMPERKMFFDGGGKNKASFADVSLARAGPPRIAVDLPCLFCLQNASEAIVYDSAVSPCNPAFRGNSLTGKPQAVEKYPRSFLHPEPVLCARLCCTAPVSR